MWKIDYKINKNAEPWLLSFSERSKYLRNCAENGNKIAVHIYGNLPDSSTFRYRCYNVYQWLQSSNSWRSVYFFSNEINNLDFIFSSISFVIITRIQWSFEIQQFIDKLKSANIMIIFDTDDLVFDTMHLPLVINTINGDIEYHFSYVSRIGYTASFADGFTTTNNFLGSKLKQKYNKKYAIVPNSLCQEQLGVSNEILKLKNDHKKPFVIGYFSGTPSHYNDFMSIYPEIIDLLDKYPDIQLHVVGFLELPKETRSLVRNKRIVLTPLVDMLELQCLIASVDVNIAPLVINDFTECKSELKYFEAAIVETFTCVSPTGVFRECIKSGENGFLCKQGDWYNVIEALYLGDINRERIVLNAKEHALEHYSGENLIRRIEDSYDFIIDSEFIKH